MSSPLDRIEAAEKAIEKWVREQMSPLSTPESRWGARDEGREALSALVAVARAARERRDAQIDATHYHQYDPACPCCIAQDKEWAALARLGKDTAT